MHFFLLFHNGEWWYVINPTEVYIFDLFFLESKQKSSFKDVKGALSEWCIV